MTNRKIILTILGVLAAIGLIGLIFVGVIAGVTFYTIGNSQAANTARTFLKNNEKLKSDIGEVKDFGSFVSGSVNIENDSGEATINIKVFGANKTVNTSVKMVFAHGRDWRVSSASYVNESGQTIILQDPYDSRRIIFPPPLQTAA